MKVFIYKICICWAFIHGFSSCKKFVEVKLPPTQAAAEQVFSNDQTATSTIAGLYSSLVLTGLSFTNGGMSIYPGLSADEIYNTSPNDDDVFRTNNIPATNSTVIGSRFWNRAYIIVYQSNAIIGALTNATTLTPAVQQQLTGEALTIRALCYFYLINLFGDVPLITDTDYRENAIQGRTAKARVYEQLVEDLEKAMALLPATYTSTARARINKWAAGALLARIYLYTSELAKAESIATAIINSGTYSLVTNLNNVFLSSSNETIWQLVRETGNTVEGSMFVPASTTTKPAYAITNGLLNAFEPSDLRKENWVKANVVNNETFYYPYKYKVRTNTPITEYLVVFRLAEQWLIRAEANARQNKLQSALDDLNIIRKRAGLPDANANTKDELLLAIEGERQKEFFAEWGHRWFDLKRTERANAILAPIKAPNWQPTDVLYPLPFQEIQRNTALIQNEGY
jgi:hypothetical protein